MKSKSEFANLGYGMFIHYGLYSIYGRGEWVMSQERMTNEERAAIIQRLEQLEVFYMKDSVKTTAELLGISVPTVYRLMKRNGSHFQER